MFSFPNTPVKCAGAPQKIMYLTERVLAKVHARNSYSVNGPYYYYDLFCHARVGGETRLV